MNWYWNKKWTIKMLPTEIPDSSKGARKTSSEELRVTQMPAVESENLIQTATTSTSQPAWVEDSNLNQVIQKGGSQTWWWLV